MSKFPRPVAFAIEKPLHILLFLCCLPGLLEAQQTGSSDQSLFAAIDNGNLIVVEHLLQQGANLEARTTNGATPLMTATERGDVPVVSLLLEHGAKPGAKDDQDETALTYAARGGWVKAVNLLAQFSNIQEKNRALFAVVEGGPVTIKVEDAPVSPISPQNQAVEIEDSWTAAAGSLLDSGAEIEAKNEDGSTPLNWAAAFAQTEIVKLLINRGARINARDKYGNTPLMSAACQCAVATMNTADDVILMLLDHGAHINARNHDGRTALMMASWMQGDASVLEILLSHGADLAAKDKGGKTALAHAKESMREDKIQVLRKAYSNIR
jgi:ankyrin repeat protein